MKSSHIIFLFILLSVMPLYGKTDTETAQQFSVYSARPLSIDFKSEAFAPLCIYDEGFSLIADSGSLKHDMVINLSIISHNEGLLMPSNMVNVTDNGDGVRLLPNGEHFDSDNPAYITLSYNPYRLPRGYKPEDIYTFYCDSASSWYRLERISLDTTSHTITSRTSHFTDFANAIIKVPEMPESKAFVPTAMAELPDVNPLKGVPMIAIPQINNKGTAELIYPIEIPSGRHGLQPNVDMHYSSGAGNGFLGVGWALSTPAVTIDTRWGVPRYDVNNESEQYLVNGAAIIQRNADGTAIPLPYQDNTFNPRTSGITQFYARDTKNSDRINRIGTNPTDYWWAVTDKNGITTYYGRKFDPNQPQNDSIDENSVVRTEDRCIAYWAATASVDVYGNYILYTNEKRGNTVYVRQIDYTGNFRENILPVYRVRMNYQERQDKSSSGRLGVLQSDSVLLCHLLVQYHDPAFPEPDYTTNLAAYYMQYSPPSDSSLYKSLLTEVVMLDSVPDLLLDNICELSTIISHNVQRNSYSDFILAEATQEEDWQLAEKIISALSQPYGSSIPASVTQFQYEKAPLANNLFGADTIFSNTSDRELSTSHNVSWGLGGTATVGYGPDVVTTLFSGGGNYDYSRSKGECTSMLMDMNGDGLTDLVYEQNDKVWFCRQYMQGHAYAFANAVDISGLSHLAREVTNTHTWGLQLSFGADLSYSNPISTTYTDSYFSDVNGDGLPDMIDGDKILINHLSNNGTPSFDEFTGVGEQTISVHNSRCHSIIMDGEVDEHIECKLVETLVHSYSLTDFFGPSVTYDINPEEVQDELIPFPDLGYSEDEIWKNTNQDSLIHIIDSISSKPIDIPTPEPPRYARTLRTSPLVMNDSLIYRIKGDSVRVYRLEYVCDSHKLDPEIEMVRVWVAPKPGIINLQDSIALLQDMSESRLRSIKADGVTYAIQLCDSITALGDSMHLHAYDYTILKKGYIESTDYISHAWDSTFQVRKGDVLMFRLRSGDNNQFDKTRWRHIIHYAGETQDYDSQRDYICAGEGYFQALNAGTVIVTFSGSNDGTEPVVLRIQNNNQSSPYLLEATLPHGTLTISPISFSVQALDSVIFSLSPVNGSTQEPIWSDLHILPVIQYISDFQISTNSTETVRDTLTYYPDIRISHTSSHPKTSPYRKLFGLMHKGWGAFAYQNINNHDTIIIDSLVNTQILAATNAPLSNTYENHQPNIPSLENTNESLILSQINNVFSTEEIYNPVSESSYWVPIRADNRTEQWIAYGNIGSFGKNHHSNARETSSQYTVETIVEYDSSLPFRQEEGRINNFVRKKSRSIQHSISSGAIIINKSLSFGSYEVEVDYMDMNGDGFPDYVGKDGIQYSTPWGGIGKLQSVKNFSSFKSKTDASGTAFSACSAQLEKITGDNIRSGYYHLNASMGASAGLGSSSTRVQFADVNADGLPDKINVDSCNVRYNLGYRFSNPYPMNVNVSEGANTNGSFNANFSNLYDFLIHGIAHSLGQLSISGGVGTSTSTNITNELLIDINGDGLPDKIHQGTNGISVAYNTGNQTFSSYHSLSGVSMIDKNVTNNITTTIGVTGGFTFMGTVKFNIGIQISPVGFSSTRGEVVLTDMNGDGLADYVYKSANGAIHVRYNKTGKANLLKTVINPTGQRIHLDYSLSEPSTTHKSRQWNLKRIVNLAPNHPITGAHSDTITIEYVNAYYDNYEKTDYGYEYVQTVENREKENRSFYHNQSYLLNGELREGWILDQHGNPYIHSSHTGRYLDIFSGQSTNNGLDICDDANARVEKDGYWTEYYEGESSPQIITHYDVKYDQYHNLIEYIDEGDVSFSSDDWKQVITYLPNTANNMVSLPKTEKVYSANGKLLRSSSISYTDLGEPAHMSFIDTIDNITATTHFLYDDFGNISTIIAPEDVNNDNYWTQYIYDPITHTHVIRIDNPHQVQTRTTYDYRWGLPKNILDPSGNEMHYIYDNKGRLEKVRSPIEIRHHKPYTVKYTYNLLNHNLVASPSYSYMHVYKDMYDSLFTQQEVSIFDERGRMLQKKHYAEWNGTDRWIVDGAEDWDAFGRVIAQEYPFKAQAQPSIYEPINSQVAVVHTAYDIMDRPILQTNADASTKTFLYHFKNDTNGIKRFLTKVTDENGIITKQLRTPQDWLVQLEAGDGSATLFEYSPIGELIYVFDAEGYKTIYNYDMLGRLTSRNHPDAGETKLTYDKAGNLIFKETANLSVNNEKISYHYDFSRLKEIKYPYHPENEVYYIYDPAGRIAKRYDGTGSEEYMYDMLGNVAQTTRRIVIPTETKAYTFRMQYKYDSFGRIRNIIYPDGEVVHYGYTTGGLLKTVAGGKQGHENIYLWNRIYDEQNRKTYQLYGNGVWNQYAYDSDRQWITSLHTELPNIDVLQNIEYKYDHVGNITDIIHTATPLPAYSMGGSYTNDYQYDQQYRLIQSTGYFTFPYSSANTYSPSGRMGNKYTNINAQPVSLQYGYDNGYSSHQPRIAYNSINNEKIEFFWDANGNMAQMVACKLDAFRLHEWDEENRLRFALGNRYAGYYGYDSNGERVYKLIGTCNLSQLNSGNTIAQVIFDDAVLYPNPFLVITPKGYTKHYYSGSERIATVTGMGGFSDMVPPEDNLSSDEEVLTTVFDRYEESTDPFYYSNVLGEPVQMVDIEGNTSEYLVSDCDPVELTALTILTIKDMLHSTIYANEQVNDPEDEIYYYHGDHLGSANWITDAHGDAVQYIHYAPYGELIANQTPYLYDERYKFTGKERDEETGYDFFGARYYTSIFSHWLSVDPLADKYPNISPYAYCLWNPVKFVDPNGREVEADESAQQLIRYSLTPQESKYVRFNKNGKLDHKRLMQSKSMSTNMCALKELSQSELTYVVTVSDKKSDGASFSTNPNSYTYGVTEMPGAENDPSIDKNVHVIIGDILPEEQQVKTLAHELYGHAYIYELTRDYIQASHAYKYILFQGEYDNDYKVYDMEIKRVDTNTRLDVLINIVTNEASYNYELHRKSSK